MSCHNYPPFFLTSLAIQAAKFCTTKTPGSPFSFLAARPVPLTTSAPVLDPTERLCTTLSLLSLPGINHRNLSKRATVIRAFSAI